MELDERFSRIYKDPRFKKVPRKFRKVRIDSRFKSMFTDKRFQTKYSVDKRGRPLKQTSSDHLEKFYDLSDSSDSDDYEDLQTRIPEKKSKRSGKGSVDQPICSEKNSGYEDPADEDKVKDNAIVQASDEEESTSEGEPDDVADIRGSKEQVQNPESSDEHTDDEANEEESDDQGLSHDWGELDKDARREERAETNRLAICNLDWDRVGANDLYVLFSSFVPSGGSIKSIKVYQSDYGLQRMKEEELSGPKELREVTLVDTEEEDEDNVEGSQYHTEKLRQYQLQRFKYYYAVMECDSVATANRIYEECDNQEFELSATRLDLRFIPDETTFDREPVSEVSGGVALESYEPSDFSSTALQQSRVKLTWDEADPKRMQVMTKAFSKEEVEDMDIKTYLASSSDEESEIATMLGNREIVEDGEGNNEEESRLRKYRALINEIEAKEKKEDDDQDMEISWTPGLGDGLLSADSIETDRKKRKRNVEKKTSVPSESEEEADDESEKESGDAFSQSSDDENSEALTSGVVAAPKDEKANERSGVDGRSKGLKRRKKHRKEVQMLSKEEEEAQEKSKNELQLLLMDDQEEKQHFSLKSILEKEKKKKRKKLRRKKGGEDETEDKFKLDVHDQRFDALFSSHLFALDPSDSQFRKTTATEVIIEEKQRRKKNASTEKPRHENNQDVTPSAKKMDPSLSALIKSVKSRTIKHRDGKVGKSVRSNAKR